MRTSPRRHALAALVVGALLALVTGGAAAARSVASTAPLPFPVTNRLVRDSVGGGSTLYISGGFTEVGPNTGSFAAIGAASWKAAASLPPIDLFTHIGSAPDGNVTTLAATTAGKLYVGGQFTALGGQPRNGLGAVDVRHSQVTGWDPHADDAVTALVTADHGRTVAVGGAFNSIGSVTRDGLAAIDLDTGAIEPFAPTFGFNGQAGEGEVDALALSTDGATLYVGGHIDSADGQKRDGLAAFSTAEASLTTFDSANEDVSALAVSPDGSTVYAAGLDAIEALSTSDGSGRWSDPPGGYLEAALAVSPNGSTLYVGGSQPALFALSTATGAAVPGFDPPQLETDGDGALLPSPDGSTLYAAGSFSLGNPATSRGLVGFDAATGAPTFEPTLEGNGKALALSADGRRLFVGGNFGSLDGQARTGIGEIDIAQGAALPAFAPLLGGAQGDGGVDSIALAGASVTVAGDFTLVDGGPRRDLARFSSG